MRLKSGIWVAAYLRRCNVEGVFAAVRRRGAEEAGAIFIKVNRLDGTGTLYGPAPQAVFDEARPVDRMFMAQVGREGPPQRLSWKTACEGNPAQIRIYGLLRSRTW